MTNITIRNKKNTSKLEQLIALIRSNELDKEIMILGANAHSRNHWTIHSAIIDPELKTIKETNKNEDIAYDIESYRNIKVSNKRK